MLFLSDTALLIQEGLGAGLSPEDVAKSLVESFGIAYDSALADVNDSIDLINRSLPVIMQDDEENPAHYKGPTPCADNSVRSETYRLFDRFIRVHYHNAEIINYIDAVFPAAAEGGHTDEISGTFHIGRDFLYSEDGGSMIICTSPEHVKTELMQALIEAMQPGRKLFAFCHAATALSGDAGVILPAFSGSGKSTLISALINSGFGYGGDDVCALLGGQDIASVPIPTKLSIKDGSLDTVRQWFPDISGVPVYNSRDRNIRYLSMKPELIAKGPFPIRLVIAPEYRKGAHTEVIPLTPLQCLSTFAESGIWLNTPVKSEDLSGFLALLSRVRACRITYSMLDEAVAAIKEALLDA